MKKPFFHVCVLASILMGTMLAQDGSPLRVTLRLDRQTYELKGEAVIEVLLTNSSSRPIFVYSNLGWGESASLSIWLKDATTGKDIGEENVMHDSITPPPTSGDDFVKILPGHVYGRLIRSSIAHLNIRKKGSYEVVAEYHSPIPPNKPFGLPIWSANEPTLQSNRVTITVAE